MYSFDKISNKKEWEALLTQPNSSGLYPFFQSFDWGEVEKELGDTLYRFGIFENKELVGVCSVIDVHAKRGHFLHVRHGPVFKKISEEILGETVHYLCSLAKEKHASFLRVSPLLLPTYAHSFAKLSFLPAPIHNMDAEICWVLDIQKSEEEILKQMRKTHRYLIRKAMGMDIKIIQATDKKEIDLFLNLYQNLSKRKHFVPHKGIREEFEVIQKENNAVLFLAYFENRVISGAMIVFTPEMAIYRHGASLQEYNHIPASYLLQWEAIREAKKRNKKLYNFWGIAPLDKPNHPWQGLTLFKTGFGGERQEFLHAQDLPITMSYWKSYLIEAIRKTLRGY